jgi:hypothetical protein
MSLAGSFDVGSIVRCRNREYAVPQRPELYHHFPFTAHLDADEHR